MKLPSRLLCDTVQVAADDHILILNSAADPFVAQAARHLGSGSMLLAEDNIAAVMPERGPQIQHIAFHECIARCPAATMDVAVMNLLYQPSKAWMLYGIEAAHHALREGGHLYIAGSKERGIISLAQRVQDYFGNVETLEISKGHRVLHTRKTGGQEIAAPQDLISRVFARGTMDEGTRILLDALEVYVTDEALDLGCGAGYIGLHIAQRARKGFVTMVDASLAAVAASQQAVEQSGLTNVRVLPSDGTAAVAMQRFDLVATNPPFHLAGIETREVAERFMREAAQVLRPKGRLYVVANRFLKYEPVLQNHFSRVAEVGGNTRYKVLLALKYQERH
jgi:16S rRNA (guanine1207-N2)-methyltransferase